MPTRRSAIRVSPGQGELSSCFYSKVAAAVAHPLVERFFSLSNEAIADLFCAAHPNASRSHLLELLTYQCRHFPWAGCDLLHVLDPSDQPTMLVIETNSCASGQKSMPAFADDPGASGYQRMMETLFANPEPGRTYAVVFDKNEMEARGYALAMADHLDTPVWLVQYHDEASNPPVRFAAGALEVRDALGAWHPVDVAFRYITQRPWNRVPINTRSVVLNPIIACLAGGRNKLLAAKAYERLNTELAGSGLEIRTPPTTCDVLKSEVPACVLSLGGKAVVKVPYSNAGQGVYVITSPADLAMFMDTEHPYDHFIVQGLVDDAVPGQTTALYRHIGTAPDTDSERYVYDLRLIVGSGAEGMRPIGGYSRKALAPLDGKGNRTGNAWEKFGTNLSYKDANGAWKTAEDRLIPLCSEGFEALGLGLEQLVEAYVQTVLAVIAIDKMAHSLLDEAGELDVARFLADNGDPRLVAEIAGLEFLPKPGRVAEAIR